MEQLALLPVEREKEEIIEYVLKDWIEPYYSMKLKSGGYSPKVTSTISDMPSSPNNSFRSSTEDLVIKNLTAKEWIIYFHSKLNNLPEQLQQIIEKKYLCRGSDGKYPLDQKVYLDLHLSRTVYYIRRKQALYWLGLALKGDGENFEATH
ncbi:ArpU family phage packaging/lysis transcriptional regulator [Pseudobacillus sp. 179-B 2D1 NHS]|uniref:ArpU family phage packaging/lysis transcriptional regulator n=1 Tax=Pseudobacillus sp. 179-B 2D1 NHS TaxID=3374292 RepID=UPI00387A6484